MTKLVHPELSYQVRGVLFDVHNALGPGLKEAYYRDAAVIGLAKRGIACQPEKPFEVYYGDVRIGLYYVDIWVEGGKMLLEIKVAPAIEPLHKAQAISYLKVTNADLAVVANYGGPTLKDERLPNFLRARQPELAWNPQRVAPGLLYPELVNRILRACHRVHLTLGPGFLHQVYRRATMVELGWSEISYTYIQQLPVIYQSQLLGYQDVRLILVEDRVLLAAFALRAADEKRSAAWTKRLKALLRQMNLKLGLLANFHGGRLEVTPVRVK